MKGVLVMRKVLKNLLLGAAWGCTVNCIVCLVIAFCIGEIGFTANEFLIQVIASVVVGIGFTLPTLIYKNEHLSQAIKMLIHLGIGFVIYFPTAFFVGWFPKEIGVLGMILCVAIVIFISLIVYFFFYLYYKNEANIMNKKIKEKML